MGGGEYNNLGHYVYLKNEDGTYEEVGEVPKIPVMPELEVGGIVDNSESLFVEQSGFEIECDFKLRPTVSIKLARLLFTNNFLKMHGKPMYRSRSVMKLVRKRFRTKNH